MKMKSVMLTVMVFALSCFGNTNGLFEFRLNVEEDVTLQDESTKNFNNLQFLIVGRYSGEHKKRSLLRFEDVPSDNECPLVASATMYIYYLYSDKGSCSTDAQAPSFPRIIQAHRVLEPWLETQANAIKSHVNNNWHMAFLGLNDDDAASNPTGHVTINPSNPPCGFVGIDVTSAVKKWKMGKPNYGVVIWATNENSAGHDIRFASNADCDANRHAYIIVRCLDVSSTLTPTPTATPCD